MKFARTTFLSGIITLIRISSGFVASKVIAVITGPTGVALLGTFNNFVTIALNFGNGAINTGIIKYSAEYLDDEPQFKKLLSTSLKITIGFSVLAGLILVGFSGVLSQQMFSSEEYSLVFRVFGLTIGLYSLNTLFLSILNGRGQIEDYTKINTIGSLIGLFLTVLLVYFFHITGALYSLVIAQSVVFFITLFFVAKNRWFSIDFFNLKFDKTIAIKLSKFSLMAIVSATLVPVAQIIIRNYIIADLGVTQAGYWQAMMRVSDGYLMLITTSLGTYYLPKLSYLKTDAEIQSELFKGFKYTIPFVIIGCAIIYFFRFYIIRILFSSDFQQMEELFLWQLIGDVFKVASVLIAYLLIAKSMTKQFIWIETIFNLTFVLFGFWFINLFDIKGVTIAFMVNYIVYFIFMLIFFRKLLFGKHH